MIIAVVEDAVEPKPWASQANLIATGVFAALAVLSFLFSDSLVPAWMRELPASWRIGIDAALTKTMKWLVEDATFGFFTFKDLTRSIADVLNVPLEFATSVLSSGIMSGRGSSAVQLAPPLPWVAVCGVVTALGYRFGGRRLAILAGGCFLYLAVFGQWMSAMVTLSSIVVAAPLGIALGLLAGVLGYRVPLAKRIMTPILDLMQTVPTFAYLIPILFLFGFGPVAAMLATMIYALPPMVRITISALEGVPQEIVEYGTMAGTTPRQMITKVMLPAARPQLLVGVNQVIMLSLNMVIIASMIGAGGLGFDVLNSLRRLDIGRGLEAGVAIVVLAIALDRLSQAYADGARQRDAEGGTKKFLIALTASVGAVYVLGFFVPSVATYPDALQISTAPWWSQAVAWINVNFFDVIDGVKTFILLNLLLPVKRFMLAQPWPLVVTALAYLGWRLGGARLAALVAGLALFIVVTGQWSYAMVTVYLCGISVIFSALIGIPLGIYGGLSPRAWRVIEPAIDTLQTLPSFVYLIPAVMLFRVGDFTAMLAVVLYALAPAVRFSAHGVSRVPLMLIEAGTSMGCTQGQILHRIRLPFAMPTILIGINQTIMLALSMLVITALVGTRDLGQQVYMALTQADTGKGLVAGFCVAAIAIIADRLINAFVQRLAAQRNGVVDAT
jgi:glycine betaine/proline transport system permease protein